MWRKRHLAARYVIPAFLLLPAAGPAWAGPLYLTDDSEPTDVRHREIYAFSTGSGALDGPSGEAGVDVNYGLASDLQSNLVLPAAFSGASGFTPADLQIGPGDVQVAAKIRLPHQETWAWVPDIAIYPRVVLSAAPRSPAAAHAVARGFADLAHFWSTGSLTRT